MANTARIVTLPKGKRLSMRAELLGVDVPTQPPRIPRDRSDRLHHAAEHRVNVPTEPERLKCVNVLRSARDDRAPVGDSQRRRHGRRLRSAGMDAVATKVKRECGRK